MNFKPKFIPRFQEGGMPQQGQAQEQDPIVILAQMSQQALQNQDCQMAMQVCQAFLQVVQQAQGGGGEAAPAEEEQGEPVYAKNGAKLIRRFRKAR